MQVKWNLGAPYVSLKTFKKLQILHCTWGSVLACSGNEPTYNGSHDEDNVVDIMKLQSHRLTTCSLCELLPDSLIVLQLTRCPKNNGLVRDQIIELLSSKHPNLRRIEIDSEIDQDLHNLACQAGIDLYSINSSSVCWRHPTACDCGRPNSANVVGDGNGPLYVCKVNLLRPTSRYGILMPPGEGIIDMISGRSTDETMTCNSIYPKYSNSAPKRTVEAFIPRFHESSFAI